MALALSAVLAGCGSGGARQDASEPSGNYPVRVLLARFPARQVLAQHTLMTITLSNAGAKTIPNIAVTVCNVTCAYPAPPGQGTRAAPFAVNLKQPYLANPSRAVWVVDHPPGVCTGRAGYSCLSGGPGGAVTANSNTWALGQLRPGAIVTFRWGVTAVSPGTYTVAWQVAAGLTGKAKAVLASGGGQPRGTFRVRISSRPAQSYVNNNGQIVTTQSGG